jgi:MerR family copper efflux transcriptional regulator
MLSMSSFTIGEVAKRAGVGIDTVRYYERSHVLPKPERRPSGYRQYDGGDVQRLSFIRRAKELGFTLDEIRELLTLSTDRERGVRGIKARAATRLADLDARIREMQRVRRWVWMPKCRERRMRKSGHGLQKLIEACPGHGKLETCPILGALTRKENA